MDGQMSRTTTIGSFFRKKEKTTKNERLVYIFEYFAEILKNISNNFFK